MTVLLKARVCEARTEATAALQNAWPMVRISTFRPFAAAVCSSGTARITSMGSAEYASAVPTETTAAPVITAQS